MAFRPEGWRRMKSIFLRGLFSCLCLVILVLPACSNGSSKQNNAIKSSDIPQYGGTFTVASTKLINVFDPVAAGQFMGLIGKLVSQQFIGWDWTRGPAGTSEFDRISEMSSVPEFCMGMLAESWEIPEIGIVVLKARRGVHWAMNPDSEASVLMNSREVVPDDWIFNHKYLQEGVLAQASGSYKTTIIEKTGEWEVTVKTPADPLGGWIGLVWGGTMFFLLPPEVIEKYGDMRDWHNVVGTGPFMLTDFVEGNTATLVRNPDYWEKDPAGAGKGNQLPYLDAIKIMMIPDPSTLHAAFRTAQLDVLNSITSEDAETLMGSDTRLKYSEYVPVSSPSIYIRTDKTDLPYSDKRVRQALMMATNYEEIKDDLLGEKAGMLEYPVCSIFKSCYVPLEEMPDNVKDLFSFDTKKAVELLADAGYPEGFDANIILVQQGSRQLDFAQVLKETWAEVGINLNLQTVDPAAYASMAFGRSYDELFLGETWGDYPRCLSFPLFGPLSFSYVNDPVINDATKEILKYVPINMPEADRIHRELMPYIVEQAYYIPLPAPYYYTIWWPWLKNDYGENPHFARYFWIDQELKKSMTGEE
jgi:peptide/nickel transport system substrate-binding protein